MDILWRNQTLNGECYKVSKPVERYSLRIRYTKDRSADMKGFTIVTLLVDEKVAGQVVGAVNGELERMQWLLLALWEHREGLNITPSLAEAVAGDLDKFTEWCYRAGYRFIPALKQRDNQIYVLENI